MEKEGLPPCDQGNTPKQEKPENMSEDDLIRFVFDHFRNIGISTTLMISGGAVMKYRAEIPFGSISALAIGIGVAVSALFLFFWNICYGIRKIKSEFSKGRKRIFVGLALSVYIVVIMFAYKSTVMLYTDLQLKKVTPATEIGASVKPSE